jgi:hypothetical protein
MENGNLKGLGVNEINIFLEKCGCNMWSGLIWLRMGTLACMEMKIRVP